MAGLVRASKYKNVYCDPPRPEAIFSNLRLSTTTGEQSYIKANNLFFAVGLQGGGGPVAILKLDSPRRLPVDVPVFAGHAGAVTDFEFNPFNDYIFATASEDFSVKLWQIPEDGFTSTVSTSLVDLTGHSRKVTLLRFHPTAGTVLASCSADNTVKLWDAEKAMEINTIGEHDSLIQELVWDFHGDILATSAKDKHVRLIDPRTGTVSSIIENAHDGAKSIKLSFLGNTNRLFSVGFTKTSMRQMKIWDPRNTSEAIYHFEMDAASGVIMPFFDSDTHLMYLAGKGDGNVRVYEVNHEGDSLNPVFDFRSNVSAKGMAFVPKRGLNILANETARLLKLTTSSVEPLSFTVPRKAEGFQEDIFPDAFSGEPAHTVEEWLAGSSLPPKTAPLNPAMSPKTGASGRSSNHASRAFSVKSVPVLMAELNAAQTRIKVLEQRLLDAGLSIE
jgi:coronin-1B/1C/6